MRLENLYLIFRFFRFFLLPFVRCSDVVHITCPSNVVCSSLMANRVEFTSFPSNLDEKSNALGTHPPRIIIIPNEKKSLTVFLKIFGVIVAACRRTHTAQQYECNCIGTIDDVYGSTATATTTACYCKIHDDCENVSVERCCLSRVCLCVDECILCVCVFCE